jgi:hypothetical protein
MRGRKHIHRALSHITANIATVAAFTATLYYLEIIAMMFLLALLFGKPFAVITGSVLSLALTVHAILLNSGFEISRKIQLVIMDIHASFAVASVISFFVYGNEFNTLNALQLSIRMIILPIELSLIFMLTNPGLTGAFKREKAAA